MGRQARSCPSHNDEICWRRSWDRRRQRQKWLRPNSFPRTNTIATNPTQLLSEQLTPLTLIKMWCLLTYSLQTKTVDISVLIKMYLYLWNIRFLSSILYLCIVLKRHSKGNSPIREKWEVHKSTSIMNSSLCLPQNKKKSDFHQLVLRMCPLMSRISMCQGWCS